VLSDLHLDTGPYQIPPGLDFDILVAAGDMGPLDLAMPWLAAVGKPVVYVLGNHERYGTDLVGAVTKAKKLAEGTYVRVLERDQAVLEGVRFLGCTLWTDLRKLHPEFVNAAHRGMRDYSRISCDDWLMDDSNRKRLARLRRRHGFKLPARDEDDTHTLLHPSVTYLEHQASLKWLTANLNQPHDGLTVVVTHHAPSYESLRRNGLSQAALDRTRWTYHDPEPARVAAYASDGLLAGFDSKKIDLWVHGHTHAAMDYVDERIRVVCNPRGLHLGPITEAEAKGFCLLGYPVSQTDIKRSQEVSAENPFRGDAAGFDPKLVIDFEQGFERPILEACAAPLEHLRELSVELTELLPYAGRGESVPDRCIREAFEVRLHIQNEQLELVRISVLSTLDKYWDVAGLARLRRPSGGRIRFAWAGGERPLCPEDFQQAYDRLVKAINWMEQLPTVIGRHLQMLRDAAAAAMQASEAAGTKLKMSLLEISALRSIDAHEMMFVLSESLPTGDGAGEITRDGLNVLLDDALNGGRIPREWLFSVRDMSEAKGQHLSAEQLYGPSRRDAGR
jgi:predicted phosphodiesterase